MKYKSTQIKQPGFEKASVMQQTRLERSAASWLSKRLVTIEENDFHTAHRSGFIWIWSSVSPMVSCICRTSKTLPAVSQWLVDEKLAMGSWAISYSCPNRLWTVSLPEPSCLWVWSLSFLDQQSIRLSYFLTQSLSALLPANLSKRSSEPFHSLSNRNKAKVLCAF